MVGGRRARGWSGLFKASLSPPTPAMRIWGLGECHFYLENKAWATAGYVGAAEERL